MVVALRRAPASPGWTGPVLVGLLLAAVLLYFRDLDGFEGDDLNSIVPMLYLPAAKQGLIEIYRYAWQPLSYELGAGLFRLAGTPDVLFRIAPVAAAVTITLMLVLDRRASGERGLLLPLVILSCAPELLFSGLYYNSTMPGMPLLLLALLSVMTDRYRSGSVIAGLCMGLAILSRLDFGLCVPAVMMLALHRQQGIGAGITIGLAAAAVLGAGLAAGIVRPDEIIATWRMAGAEIAAKADLPGWDLRMKLLAGSTMLSPLGWAMTALAVPAALIAGLRADALRTIGWVLAFLPMLLMIKAPLSPKYVLPILPFWFLLIAATWRPWLEGRTAWTALIALAALAQYAVPAPLVAGVLPGKLAKLAKLVGQPVETHDGPRVQIGYGWQLPRVQRAAPPVPAQVQGQALLARIRREPGDFVLTGRENYFQPGAAAWRHLVLALESSGVRGVVTGPHRLLFRMEDGRTVLLSDTPTGCVTGQPSRPCIRVALQ